MGSFVRRVKDDPGILVYEKLSELSSNPTCSWCNCLSSLDTRLLDAPSSFACSFFDSEKRYRILQFNNISMLCLLLVPLDSKPNQTTQETERNNWLLYLSSKKKIGGRRSSRQLVNNTNNKSKVVHVQ